MSIKQNPGRAGPLRQLAALPDFRNLGVLLRILLFVNALGLLAVLVRNDSLALLGAEVLAMAARLEFPLILSVAALFLLQPLLGALPGRLGPAAVAAVVLGVALACHGLLALPDASGPLEGLGRTLLWSLLTLAALRAYFRLRGAVQAPALAEARLLALTARIRPHFLFNSLNGVLGVLRADPRRAEEGLEELADLFRALMQDSRELVPLCDEILLCERYLNLERLRLGERLQVQWTRDPSADAARVPPLLLQPLVENAVYHGIEPAAGAGLVSITIQRRGPQVTLEITNPLPPALAGAVLPPPGNRMALDNIRERLMLFFDLEASLDIEQGPDAFRVRIRLPFRSAA